MTISTALRTTVKILRVPGSNGTPLLSIQDVALQRQERGRLSHPRTSDGTQLIMAQA